MPEFKKDTNSFMKKSSGFKMKYKKGGFPFKEEGKSEMDPRSDDFFKPGGTYDSMTKKGYKWDGKQFVKK